MQVLLMLVLVLQYAEVVHKHTLVYHHHVHYHFPVTASQHNISVTQMVSDSVM
jgi:hypothetical protein